MSETTNLIELKYQDKVETITYTSWVVCHKPTANPTSWLTANILKIATMP